MKTSGPWKINEDRFLTGTEDEFFKNVYGSNGYACGRAYGETKEECEANASLVAAAPELLEALKSISKELRTNNDRLKMIETIETLTSAAIAKAEGV